MSGLAKRFPRSIADQNLLDWRAFRYILPLLVFYAIFLLFPIGYAIWMSFTNFETVTQIEWVGLENYETVLTSDIFWNAFKNTIGYGIAIGISILIGLLLALILNSEKLIGGTIIASIIFLPFVVPRLVSSLLFQYMFTQFGIVNGFLQGIGLIAQPIPWTSSPVFALPTALMVAIWRNIGFNMLILLAGLQSIPDSYYEAAVIAGKNRLQIFWHVTLPLLKGPLIIVQVLGLITAIRGFTEIWVVTGGGPGRASETLGVYFYRETFRFSLFGKGAAIAVIMFIIALILTVIVFRYQEE